MFKEIELVAFESGFFYKSSKKPKCQEEVDSVIFDEHLDAHIMEGDAEAEAEAMSMLSEKFSGNVGGRSH
jgi:hypothetical protein